MVGSEDIGKSLESGRSAGMSASEAAQALTAILQTQYLRYLIIASWALGLLATVASGLPWSGSSGQRRPALCAARSSGG